MPNYILLHSLSHFCAVFSLNNSMLFSNHHRPQTKLREGNDLHVCSVGVAGGFPACITGHMTSFQGGSASRGGHTPLLGKRVVRSLLECCLVTGCNEVVAKVIFLHLSVIHSVHRGGGCLPQCILGYLPPGARYTPLEQTHPLDHVHPPEADTPLGPGTPPSDQVHPHWIRYTPSDQVHPPSDQVHPPGTRYTPWNQVHPLGPGTPPRIRYTLRTKYTPPGLSTPPPGTKYTSQD